MRQTRSSTWLQFPVDLYHPNHSLFATSHLAIGIAPSFAKVRGGFLQLACATSTRHYFSDQHAIVAGDFSEQLFISLESVWRYRIVQEHETPEATLVLR
jgi:hypothetical protein